MSEPLAPETRGPVPFLQGAQAAFSLCFEGMLWSRRSLFVGLLLGFPALFAVVFRLSRLADVSTRITGLDLYGIFLPYFFIAFALPLVTLFYATALVAEEVEGRTLVYLVTRPVSRAALLAGKFAACLVTLLTLSLPAAVLSFLLLASGGGWAQLGAAAPGMVRDLGVMALAVLAYGALFTLVGVVLRRPLFPGLMLCLWEFLVPLLPGDLPMYTLSAWLRSLVPYRVPFAGLAEYLARGYPGWQSLIVLLGFSALALFLAASAFSQREYVMEQ